jgi:hypothetical protein
MKKLFFSQCMFFILFQSVHAYAACGLSFSTTNITVNWVPSFTYISVPITVNKVGPDPCDFGLGFTKGGAASYVTRAATDMGTGSQIQYQLYKENGLANILKDVPDITSANDVIQGGFAGGNNMVQAENFYFRIPYNADTAPALIVAGSFTDAFTVNLYEGSDPLAFTTPVDTDAVSVTINVPKIIAISLVSSGGGFQAGQTTMNMNLGTMYEGQSSGLDLRVRSNAGFNVSFSSLNNGNMKHVSGNSLVPYKFYVNGALLNMSNSLTVPVAGLSRSGQTAMSGLAYPIKVVVGNLATGAKLSGTHTDSITITAETTE